jgi:chemotaxis protein MotB
MKRKSPDAPEGAPDWVVSYGDCMSLLLTFFIMLYSFSTVDADKWQQLAESMRGALGKSSYSEQQSYSPIKRVSSSSGNKGIIIQAIVDKGGSIPSINGKQPTDSDTDTPADTGYSAEEAFGDLYNDLLKGITAGGNKLYVDVIRTEGSIILRFTNKILFESGYADLDEEALDIISGIMAIISDYEEYLNKLVIEGNTDNVPINTAKYRDNFELSIYRALNVFYFIERGNLFPANKVEIKGYGENNPIATNDTAEGRALNRRTDIVIMKAEADE